MQLNHPRNSSLAEVRERFASVPLFGGVLGAELDALALRRRAPPSSGYPNIIGVADVEAASSYPSAIAAHSVSQVSDAAATPRSGSLAIGQNRRVTLPPTIQRPAALEALLRGESTLQVDDAFADEVEQREAEIALAEQQPYEPAPAKSSSRHIVESPRSGARRRRRHQSRRYHEVHEERVNAAAPKRRSGSDGGDATVEQAGGSETAQRTGTDATIEIPASETAKQAQADATRDALASELTDPDRVMLWKLDWMDAHIDRADARQRLQQERLGIASTGRAESSFAAHVTSPSQTAGPFLPNETLSEDAKLNRVRKIRGWAGDQRHPSNKTPPLLLEPSTVPYTVTIRPAETAEMSGGGGSSTGLSWLPASPPGAGPVTSVLETRDDLLDAIDRMQLKNEKLAIASGGVPLANAGGRPRGAPSDPTSDLEEKVRNHRHLISMGNETVNETVLLPNAPEHFGIEATSHVADAHRKLPPEVPRPPIGGYGSVLDGGNSLPSGIPPHELDRWTRARVLNDMDDMKMKGFNEASEGAADEIRRWAAHSLPHKMSSQGRSSITPSGILRNPYSARRKWGNVSFNTDGSDPSQNGGSYLRMDGSESRPADDQLRYLVDKSRSLFGQEDY